MLMLDVPNKSKQLGIGFLIKCPFVVLNVMFDCRMACGQ